MTKEKVNVAIVGLGFGAEFIPIYQSHPQADMYAICQRNRRSWTPSAMRSASRSGTATSTNCCAIQSRCRAHQLAHS